jgi:hypothetical protein
MGENVTFKDPRVLVEIPSEEKVTWDAEGSLQSIELGQLIQKDEITGAFRFLRDFTTDHGARSQIESMLTNYNSLWKLYVFADMKAVRDNQEQIPAVYAALTRTIGTVLPVTGLWSSDFGSGSRLTDDRLLGALERTRDASQNSHQEPVDLIDMLTRPSLLGETKQIWARRLSKLGIGRKDYEAVFASLQRSFQNLKPDHDWTGETATAADKASAKKWVIEQLRAISGKLNGRGEVGASDD